MKLLFVHQNFPGQFRRLAPWFASDARHEVVTLGERHANRPVNFPRMRHLFYEKPESASKTTHHYLRELEAAVRRGQSAVRVAMALRKEGYRPDVIYAHPAWGESLYLKEIFPQAKLLNYYEFYYRYKGSDVGFDPEYPSTLDDLLRTPTRNSTQLLSFASADAGVSPTVWQRDQYPPFWRAGISVIHEGVDTEALQPDPQAVLRLEKPKMEFRRGDEVITYVSRNLEPYRGFHVFMRALPEILRRCPRAHVLIVGGDGVSYGRRLQEGQTYRKKLLAEVGADLDLARVHFLGTLPYSQYLQVLQVSSVHVYLTYPFVLSWSMLEAMATGCLVIGSRTPPVEEVLRDGENGLLVDFHSPAKLAARVEEAVKNNDYFKPLREQARATVVERYDWRTVCRPQQVALIEALAAGATGREAAATPAPRGSQRRGGPPKTGSAGKRR
jgi:glycosyltransferase involved in cell wall biosynthesis